MAFAEIALGQIRALRQPASPRNYEIWYTYATGYNPSLNQTINETLARNGTLTEADIEQIYANLSSRPTRLTDRIDSVGSQVMDEIEQVMAMIDAAAGSAIELHREPRRRVSRQLGSAKDREGVRAIVESLVPADQGNGSRTTRLWKRGSPPPSRRSTSSRRISRSSAPKA